MSADIHHPRQSPDLLDEGERYVGVVVAGLCDVAPSLARRWTPGGGGPAS